MQAYLVATAKPLDSGGDVAEFSKGETTTRLEAQDRIHLRQSQKNTSLLSSCRSVTLDFFWKGCPIARSICAAASLLLLLIFVSASVKSANVAADMAERQSRSSAVSTMHLPLRQHVGLWAKVSVLLSKGSAREGAGSHHFTIHET